MSDELVERVAWAILDVRVRGFNAGWDDSGGRSAIGYGREMARAAIAAMGDAARLRELEADNARLRDALKPFAAAADYIDTDPPEDHQPSHGRGMVKAYNLRAARAALGDKP